ncbi:hypothetical protein D3C73_1524640 [compost metagenome]
MPEPIKIAIHEFARYRKGTGSIPHWPSSLLMVPPSMENKVRIMPATITQDKK